MDRGVSGMLYLRIQCWSQGKVGHSPLFNSLDIPTLSSSYWNDCLHAGHIAKYPCGFLHLSPMEQVNLYTRMPASASGPLPAVERLFIGGPNALQAADVCIPSMNVIYVQMCYSHEIAD